MKYIKFNYKINKILAGAQEYHDTFYASKIFGGPSLYFHKRAIETKHKTTSLEHLQFIYSVLVSWGMHRMGKRGAKMEDFDIFKKSIINLKNKIRKAKSYKLINMSDKDWDELKSIFIGIQIMKSHVSLIGNSKVMHHLLPNIVPPIDREYTLSFLRGGKNINIKANKNMEWDIMREIIMKLFKPIVNNPKFNSLSIKWMKQNKYPWDTSPLKIIDNLIIGAELKKRAK